MGQDAVICAVCAWRETCQKKFSISGRDMTCADFTRDMKVPSPEAKKDESPDASEK